MKNFYKRRLSKLNYVALTCSILFVISCSKNEVEIADVSQTAISATVNLSRPEVGLIYNLRNRNSNRYMEIENASNSNGANLRQSELAVAIADTHRQWEIINTGNGFVRLRGVDSRKSLEVKDGANSNGANVEQRAFNGVTHQQWEIIPTNDGFYRIRSRDSRKSIAVEDASTSEGANIEINNWNGNDKFEWAFEEVRTTDQEENEGVFGLNPDNEPWENFDLTDWSIDTPAQRPDDECRAVRSNEDEWNEFRESTSSPYFFTHTDGGMRFVSPVGGATTSRSCNSGFPRSELREQLREGNTDVSTTGANANNWALGYQPDNAAHGGRNGRLAATLRINQVTTTGDGLHLGRTIIGQIHASDDEPARLYYRKCPDAEFGSIYLEHEINGASDVTFNLIGNEQCDGNGPSNGIRLDELFSYEIINDEELIIVNIRRGSINDPIIATTTVNMEELDSGYDERDEWMYFKAGLYTQNNTGDADDSDIATLYYLENTHDNN